MIKRIISGIGILGMSMSAVALDWSGPTYLDVPYKTADGQTLVVDIYAQDSATPSPVVVYTHGGGWSVGDENNIDYGYKMRVALELLDRGVTVVSVDYRLALDGNLIQDCVTDALDACRFISKNAATYNIDKDKMALFGDSAGAQIAMMVSLVDPEYAPFIGDAELSGYNDFTIVGCAAWYGPVSFRTMDDSFWSDGGRNPRGFDLRLYGDETDEDQRDSLRELNSPIVYLTKNSPPLFLAHGDMDTTIPVYHVYGMEAQADAVGYDKLSYQIAENAGHNFRAATTDPVTPPQMDIVTLTADKLVSFLDPIVESNPYVQIRKVNAPDYCLNGGSGGADAQNVSLWTYIDGHANLTWEEIDRGNGYYSYQKKGTTYSLDGGSGGANRQNVYLWSTSANNYNQQWQKIDKGNGGYQLKKRNANYGINGGSGGANNQNVDLWSIDSPARNLQWIIEYK